MPITVFHKTAIPSIRLTKNEFDDVTPFLKVFFTNLDRAGFDLSISHWGEIILHSLEKDVSLSIVIYEDSQLENINWPVQKDYQVVTVENADTRYHLKYRVENTRTKWRKVSIRPTFPDKSIMTERFITPMVQLAEQYSGRAKNLSIDDSKSTFSLDDIIAVSRFGLVNEEYSFALRSIVETASKYYFSEFIYSDESITLKSSQYRGDEKFLLSKSDISLFEKYLPGLQYSTK